MKTIENQSFLPIPNAMGRSVSVKTPAAFQIINKINGFEHIYYGTALKANNDSPQDAYWLVLHAVGTGSFP